MPSKILKIKNMVCPRCIKVVKEELEKLGYETSIERLGSATIKYGVNQLDLNKISTILNENGFELLVEKNAKLIDELKSLIIDLIYTEKLEELNINLSGYLSNKLNHDYSHLSTLFSSVEGITVEKYFILQKIERVKELLIYDELSLSEISYKLGYGNVQYLSTQFKKITGMSPSEFKALRNRARNSIDKIRKS
ncbi:AraC family transcriptional regulator [Candidatus Neomarinimicrobiota bacterium]